MVQFNSKYFKRNSNQAILITFYSSFFYEKTSLHEAAENDDIRIVKLLLEHKNIDVNVKDDI